MTAHLAAFQLLPRLAASRSLSVTAGQKDVPLVKPREAAARVKVMEACYRSARQRKWIEGLGS